MNSRHRVLRAGWSSVTAYSVAAPASDRATSRNSSDLGEEETPNQGAHPNDVVQLPKVHENDLVYVDDVEYRVTITGFLLGQGSRRRRVSTFDVPEGGSISAGIFARFERTSPPGS
ncbi:hypothetical protein [Parafrankia sp. EAN1pec]|uniref:hypothetical protein n=1 Tax=Parafrankia sp. (strain EAN1pec) TaxID=298653 RepID=UPI00005448C0